MKKKVTVGIDVSKSWLDAHVIVDDPSIKAWLRVNNSFSGFVKLVGWVKNETLQPTYQWIVCMEYTGTYSYRLNKFLEQRSICQCLVNPLAIKRSMGIVRGKTDRADARLIALYAKRFSEKLEVYELPSQALQKLKVQLVQRERLIGIKRQIELANGSLTDIPASITRPVLRQNNQLRKQLAQDLKDMDQMINVTIQTDEKLNALARMMESIPGVGRQISAYVLVTTQGMSRFTTSRKFACYCGVAPFEYASGSSYRAKTKVHYLANRKMKTLLHMGALSTLKAKGELKKYYERKLSEGKHPMSVINVVRFKLIDRIFAVVKKGESYDRNYTRRRLRK